MAKNDKTVDHLGVIQEIVGQQITVCITSLSACASCHAKGACSASDSAEKVITVFMPNHSHRVGESVKVVMKQALGFKALFLGYLLPFLLVLLVLIAFTTFDVSEGKTGLATLAVLPIYYLILYFFRDRISKEFNFEIEPI